MTDKNCVEIKTGMIVEISGAYFKSDNGLYYVEHSPGDPGWSGSDHCLKKISKAGKISTAKYNLCFWPIMVTVNGPKYYDAKRWNAEHATIEVKPALVNMSEVAGYFKEQVDGLKVRIERLIWDFGENSDLIRQYREILEHYEAVALAVAG